MQLPDYDFLEWANVAGLVIGVLGLCAAYWQYVASKEECRPTFQSVEHRIIGPFETSPLTGLSDGKFSILYEDRTITSASRAVFAFWNSGRRTLEKGQIVGKLEIELPKNCVILGEPRVLKQTRESIDFTAKKSDHNANIAELGFSFLDRQDGALVEVLYAGQNSSRITLSGDFKASRQLVDQRRLLVSVQSSLYERVTYAIMGASIIFGVLSIFTSALAVLGFFGRIILRGDPFGVFPMIVQWEAWIFLICSLIGLAIFVVSSRPIVLNRNIRRLPRKLRHLPPSPPKYPERWQDLHLAVWRMLRGQN